ncbi:MAG: NAD(P)/FAD-dependent oxidoreductase [Nanoarchaeota archaeon]|nr:NAD(P)/FAD-dependent oxidoreductase [Nanoarchaeota archaeon]
MISIIGGGPIGCYLGYLLAKHGKKVEIVEEHKVIGKPVSCTGLVTSKVFNYLDVPNDIIQNRISKVRIYSPNDFLELKLRKPDIVLNRGKFDHYIAELAKKAGADIKLGVIWKDNKGKEIIIGADGPFSKVSEMIGNKKTGYMVGIQIRAELKNDNAIEFYPYIGKFAWVVPENERIVKIGLVGTYDEFLKFMRLKDNPKIIEYQSGIIPVYDRKKKIQKNRTYLVGDAAGHVKATTGGGIIPGLTAAESLCKCIIKNKNYRKSIWKLRLELWLHLRLSKMMDKFNDKDWDRLIKVFKKPRNRKLIENIDRDNLFKIMIRLIKEPKLYYFIKYL